MRRWAWGAGFGLLMVLAALTWFVKGQRFSVDQSLQSFAKGELSAFTFAEEFLPLPEQVFVDADGQEKTLADYRGKVILVNLWATWCAPCLEEMPTLDRLKAEVGSDRFDVLAISVDKEGPEKSQAFLDKVGVEHLALLSDATMSLMFDLRAYGLPTTILFDEEGREIGRVTGPAEWDSDDAKALIGRVVEGGDKASGASASKRIVGGMEELDYESLKAFLIYYFENYIDPEGRYGPDVHPAKGLEEREKKSPSQTRDGVQMAVNDIVAMSNDLSARDLIDIDNDLKKQGIVTIAELRFRFTNDLEVIMKRGSIRSDIEYYLMKEVREGSYPEQTADKTASMDDMLSRYEQEAVEEYEAQSSAPENELDD